MRMSDADNDDKEGCRTNDGDGNNDGDINNVGGSGIAVVVEHNQDDWNIVIEVEPLTCRVSRTMLMLRKEGRA